MGKNIGDEFKELARNAMRSLDDTTELDEQIVKWIGSRQAKIRFFMKAGPTTVYLLLVAGALAGATLVGSAWALFG